METAIWILLGLTIKHFVVDFPLQGPFQYQNKGTYGHPGGLLHASLHGAGTAIVLGVSTPTAMLAAVIDALAHYHIDWAKVRINARMGWGPTTHKQFWWLLGFDQLLHYLTYFAIVFWVSA